MTERDSPPDRGHSDPIKEAPQKAAEPTGPIEFRFFGRTDVGLIREHNEDNFLATDLSLSDEGNPKEQLHEVQLGERGLALAVCDGMGGAAAGEIASKMAVDTVFEFMRGEAPAANRDEFARRLVRAIEQAGIRIFESAKKDKTRRGMGTTATVAGLMDKVLFVGQVGDSRCYILRGGELSLVTKDQSLVNQLIEAGQLTEAEAEEFEHTNIILQALGTTEQVSVDLTFMELRQGDRILLCSDGLSGLVHDDVIKELMIHTKDLSELAERLIEMANAAGGHDNITCIVADVAGSGLESKEGAPRPNYQQYPLPLAAGEAEHVGGTTGPVIKSIRVRPMITQPVLSFGPESTMETRAFSWPVAAILLLLLGLVAMMTQGVGRSEPTTLKPSAPVIQAAVLDAPVEAELRADSEQEAGEEAAPSDMPSEETP